MMDKNLVMERFAAVTGAAGAELEGASDFCEAAARAIGARLRSRRYVRDPRAVYAAACVAVYKAALARESSGGVESFKAGDVSVNCSQSLKAAEKLMSDAMAEAAPLLKSENFYFAAI